MAKIRKPGRRVGKGGFSFIEAIITTGIMGALVAVGVPKYRSFQATAYQSEAKNNLAHIYTLQQSYVGDAEEYAALAATGAPGGTCASTNAIGFKLNPCSTTSWTINRYQYTATVSGGTTTPAFDAFAKTNPGGNTVNPKCNTTVETQAIDETKTLTITNDSRGC